MFALKKVDKSVWVEMIDGRSFKEEEEESSVVPADRGLTRERL